MSAAMEEWRPIVGFDGYEASSLGHVRSAKPYAGQLRVLSEWANQHGYLTVQVRTPRGRLRVTVHRLVALAFLGPRPTDREVAHWDGDRQNNAAANLRYATHSENMQDQIRHGRHNNARREVCNRGHVLAGDNVLRRADRPNSRECRPCRAITKRALAAKGVAA